MFCLAIYQWLLYISNGDRLKLFVENMQEDLFTSINSKYCKVLLDLVKNHIEDLVCRILFHCLFNFNLFT